MKQTKQFGFTPLEIPKARVRFYLRYNRGNRKFLTGFTLIELLVVIFITAMLATILTVSFRALRNSQEINSSTADISSKIREVQNNVLTGKYITATTAPRSYAIIITANSQTYDLQYNTLDALGNNTTSTPQVLSLINNTKIQRLLVGGVPKPTVVLRIDSPYGDISVDGGRRTLQIDIQHTRSSAVKSISIDPISGRIGK